MIVSIPLQDQLHDDPEWSNWQAFIREVELNEDLNYFLHRLLSEPVFRHRIFNFLDTSWIYELRLQEKLEQSAEACRIDSNPASAPISKVNGLRLSIQIQPSQHPNFSQVFGNWAEFEEAMLGKNETIADFLQTVKTSKEARREVIQFLQDATRFEDNVSQKFQALDEHIKPL